MTDYPTRNMAISGGIVPEHDKPDPIRPDTLVAFQSESIGIPQCDRRREFLSATAVEDFGVSICFESSTAVVPLSTRIGDQPGSGINCEPVVNEFR